MPVCDGMDGNGFLPQEMWGNDEDLEPEVASEERAQCLQNTMFFFKK
jgi:hypothetical protein